MKQRILSVALALCLCISSQPAVYASQKAALQQEDVFMEESADELKGSDDERIAETEEASEKDEELAEESADEVEKEDGGDKDAAESEGAAQEEEDSAEESTDEAEKEDGGDEDAAESEGAAEEEEDSAEESTDEAEEENGDDEDAAESEDTAQEEEEATEESVEESESNSDDEDAAESEDTAQEEEEVTEESVADSDNVEDSNDEDTVLPEESLPEDELLQEEELIEEYADEVALVDVSNLTPAGVYEAMIALKKDSRYEEGTPWTNNTPYPDANGDDYKWNGGKLDGKNISAVGCVAFAFILSDAAFGNLPARMYARGGFSYKDIKVGDILRMNTDTHTVIVLEVSEAGVVVAEGNFSTGDHKGKVHWGRTISKEVVMRDTSHYITRYPENYIAPDDPDANKVVGSGTLAGGLTWKLTKAGTLTISGKGAMPNFASTEKQPWNNYSGDIRKVVIENGVTSIGDFAFADCGVLSVDISSSVKAIGIEAFSGSSIISVAIPPSVKTIGDSAFHSCEGLSVVAFFEGLETIEEEAFYGCTSLISIDLPASIGKVGYAAFMDCIEMINASFASGSNQVKLGDNLFTQCYKLMNVTLPKSIDHIGDGMFQNCGMLLEVEIPKDAVSIGGWAFASSGVSVVIIPDSVKQIGIAAFSACPLTDIYFTGTESQWKNIQKLGDTESTVLKAKIHYNYVPPQKPDDNDNTGGNTGDGSGDNTGGNTGDGSGDNTGGNTGDSSGDNTGGNTGDGSGDNTGGNTGDGSGDNTGGNTGDGSGGNTGGNTGNGSGSNTGNGSGNNSSGGSSNGSSSGSSSSSRKDRDNNQNQNTSSNSSNVKGQWVAEDTGNTKGTGWKLKNDDGTYIAGTVTADASGNISEQVAWAKVNGAWYAFGADGYADSGWVMDEAAGSWYYVDIDSGMQTGWHNDASDGSSYFMDPVSGKMLTGWNLIEGKWYYFNEFTSAPTWQRDGLLGDWVYTGAGSRPFGAMFKGETTPDGYIVDENGAWIG